MSETPSEPPADEPIVEPATPVDPASPAGEPEVEDDDDESEA